MSRVTNILDRVRLELGDVNNQRYEDSILLGYLNEGLKEFTLATKFLTDRLYLTLNIQSAIYDISPYVLDIVRAEYMNTSIKAKKMSEMDSLDPNWQSVRGDSVKFIVLDKHRKGRFRVYPRVEGSADLVVQNSPYGGLIDITIGDDDYQIPSIEDIEQDIDKFLVLYVVTKPKIVTLATLDSAWEIPDEFDKVFIHYIKYVCLRSDTDAGNRAYGNEEYTMYNNYIVKIQGEESMSNNKVDTNEVSYWGGLN